MRRSHLAFLLVTTLALGLTPEAAAVVVYVDASAAPGGDGLTPGTAFQTIQQGVDAAAAGDTVSVAPGTYMTVSARPVTGLGLATAVVFMKDLVSLVASSADPALTVIDGGGTARGVVFESAVASLAGFTIRNGLANDSFGGAGVLSLVSMPTISNSIITGNDGGYRSGGIGLLYGSRAVLTGNTISGNGRTSYYYFSSGGGMGVVDSTATLTGNTISGNTARLGGGIYVRYGNLLGSSNTISGNAANYGGGIYTRYGFADLSNLTIDGNQFLSGGQYYYYNQRGGGISALGSYVVLDSASILNNGGPTPPQQAPRGGGLDTVTTRLRVSNSIIAGNQARAGGAIELGGYTATTLSQTQVDGNIADLEGGGILQESYGYATALTIEGGSISNNQSLASAGGGIAWFEGGSLSLDGVAIVSNTAAYAGGGISASGGYNYGGLFRIHSSLIEGNRSLGGSGGGIAVQYGVIDISRNQIRNNTAAGAGGGIEAGSVLGRLDGNEITGNAATGGYGGGVEVSGECSASFDSCGTTLTLSNNLITKNSASSSFGGTGGGGVSVRAAFLAVTNSTISGNDAPSGQGGGLRLRVYDLQISNSIIEGNTAATGGGIYHQATSYYGSQPSLVTASDLFANSPDDWASLTEPSPVGSAGNLSQDPLFVIPGTDFRLTPASPGIDAGDPTAAGIAGPDLAGLARLTDGDGVAGAAIDMGAYELPSTATDPAPTAIAIARLAFRTGLPFPVVVLDGSRSFDSLGDGLTFRWSQTSGPPVTIDDATSPMPRITMIGTPRAPVSGEYGFQSAPTSLHFTLTVSDGRSSDSDEVEVRMGPDGVPVSIELTGIRFAHERDLSPYYSAISSSGDGSFLYAVSTVDGAAELSRAPIVRDSRTGRMVDVGEFQFLDDLTSYPRFLCMHPSGTPFLSDYGPIILEVRPDGTEFPIDLSGFGISSASGLAFVPAGLPNAGDLLVVDVGTSAIYSVALQDNGDGTFTPTATALWALLLGSPILSPDAIAFVTGSTGPTLYVADYVSTIFSIPVAAATGLPVGGAATPGVVAAFTFPLGVALHSATSDPLGDTFLTTTEPGGYPSGAILFFEPLPLDFDDDGAPDLTDNCPTIANGAQADGNANGIGDSCDNVVAAGVDLSLAKSHVGDFGVGSQGSYTLALANLGATDDPGPIQVVDTLPAGLTFASASGAGWSCLPTGALVTCTHAGPLFGGGSLPALTLTVDVGPAAAPAVVNTAFCSGLLPDANPLDNSDSDPTTVAATGNQPPSANAGPDQNVNEAALVTLDGTLSTDPELSPLTYSWTQILGPLVTLSDPFATQPTFVAPFVSFSTSLSFALVVNDGQLSSPGDVVTVTVASVNDPPAIVAVPLPSGSVLSGDLVTLDASGTTDATPTGTLQYAWSQLGGPPVTLADPTAAVTTFTAPTVASLTPLLFGIDVTDGLESASTVVNVSVSAIAVNLPPLADAGADRRGTPASAPLVLDGSDSFDPDTPTLSYAWTQTSGPAAGLSGAATATLTVDLSGVPATALLGFTLTVSDGPNQDTDTVSVQVAPSPNWPEFRFDDANSGMTSALGPLTGGALYAMTFPAGVRSSVSFDRTDAMYVGADDGKLYALALDGVIRWTFATAGPVRTTPIVGSDGTIYVGSFDGNLYAVNPNGTLKWSVSAGSGNLFRFSSPTLHGSGPSALVYAGSSNGVLHALHAATGATAFTFTAGGAVHSSPAIYGGKVIFGSNDGFLRALDEQTGVPAWETDVDSPIQSSPAVNLGNGLIYAGADDGIFRAFNASDGSVAWSFATGGAITSSAAVDYSRNLVTFGSDDHNLYALDATTGALLWQRATGSEVRSSPTIDAAGNIYVGSCDGNVYAFDPTGTPLFTFFSGGLIIASPTVGTDGLVYIGSDDSYLYAIGPNPFVLLSAVPPRVDRIEPPQAPQGSTLEATVWGERLQEGMALDFGAGVKVSGVRWASAREMRVTLQVETGAALGSREVAVHATEGLRSTRVAGFAVSFDCRRADLSGDGGVDGIDLAVLASRFGAAAEGTSSDLDGNGQIDGVDLALLAARFGGNVLACK